MLFSYWYRMHSGKPVVVLMDIGCQGVFVYNAFRLSSILFMGCHAPAGHYDGFCICYWYQAWKLRRRPFRCKNSTWNAALRVQIKVYHYAVNGSSVLSLEQLLNPIFTIHVDVSETVFRFHTVLLLLSMFIGPHNEDSSPQWPVRLGNAGRLQSFPVRVAQFRARQAKSWR
jgi:hypothetical protein